MPWTRNNGFEIIEKIKGNFEREFAIFRCHLNTYLYNSF